MTPDAEKNGGALCYRCLLLLSVNLLHYNNAHVEQFGEEFHLRISSVLFIQSVIMTVDRGMEGFIEFLIKTELPSRYYTI